MTPLRTTIVLAFLLTACGSAVTSPPPTLDASGGALPVSIDAGRDAPDDVASGGAGGAVQTNCKLGVLPDGGTEVRCPP